MTPARFRREVWKYYRSPENAARRDLLWRKPAHVRDPYRILVSEIMLQQTQVSRVQTKYPEFIRAFPTMQTLARTGQHEVLRVWQGLGYNRRALNLKKLAGIVCKEHRGVLPRDPAALAALPGIGKATAGSIAAFAFNAPTPFIETNIRRVYIHAFFPHKKLVHDEDILPWVKKTLDRKRPREWFYALMDYGAMLAVRERVNPNRKSAAYRPQPKFAGSRRALRGAVLRALLSGPRKERTLPRTTGGSVECVREVLDILVKEGFVVRVRGIVKVAG